ncbi:MAG: SDR family NAD(P)-dependent oxidoreductase [Rhodospirillales bacterium]|jgi:NADP-dependent 3-hydroxy acid dehydrogenase YdfG|nr:SDR family NAD(P)-dependent oxidoreductase [Rhodospirillales bacterium]
MLSSKDRVIMIAGASGGIGSAIAQCLHDKGYSVSLGARNLEKLGAWTQTSDAERIMTHAYEATDASNNADWVNATVERFGRIDGVVNSAGMGGMVNLEDDDDETYDALWAVNVKGPMRMIRLTLPHLRKCGSGRIINVSSLSGKRVTNDGTGYALSKFALMAVTHATRRAGWEDGVRATSICPSWVNTDMAARAEGITREDMIQPEDLAEMAATVIALPNSAAIAELLVNCTLGDMF